MGIYREKVAHQHQKGRWKRWAKRQLNRLLRRIARRVPEDAPKKPAYRWMGHMTDSTTPTIVRDDWRFVDLGQAVLKALDLPDCGDLYDDEDGDEV